MATADPRHAYVRFYLTVLEQLEQARAALVQTAGDLRAAVSGFADVLAVSDDGDLKRVMDARATPPSTAALWRPQDAAQLTGIVDVYDVIGRFTFQGDDDANLGQLDELVRALADELERQRRALAALARLPANATQAAEGLSQQELAAAEQARRDRLAPFEPVAEQLRAQCEKVLVAIRGVARPDLASLDNADNAYRDYVRRVQGLYTAALPYLRRALQELCTAASVDLPPAWPDTLPFHPTLPPDLIAAPAAESVAVADLRAKLVQCDADEASIKRRTDELALAQRQYDSARPALVQRESEALAEALVAKNLVRWATKFDELESTRQAIAAHNQQRPARVTLVAQLEVQGAQLEETHAALDAEVSQRANEVEQTAATLEKERANPPAIFGKDEWRQRVQSLQEDLEERKATLAQRQGALEQCAHDLHSIEARTHAEKAQISLIDRAIAEAREREASLRKELSELEGQLGANKPAHRVTLAEADDYLMRVWARRNEVRGQIEQGAAQAQAARAESERLAFQLQQIDGERQKLNVLLEKASAESTVARDAALTALAERRSAAFKQHVNEVLAPLEESLSQVDRIFVDPARQVILQRSEGEAPKAGSLRAQAGGLAQAVAQLAPRIEPVLATQAEVLRRVQAEFCEKVRDAVKAAWA